MYITKHRDGSHASYKETRDPSPRYRSTENSYHTNVSQKIIEYETIHF